MNNKEKGLRFLLSELYLAEDDQVLEILDKYWPQPVTGWHDFEAVMELMPTWFLESLYKVWHDMPEDQYIVEGYIIVYQLFKERTVRPKLPTLI